MNGAAIAHPPWVSDGDRGPTTPQQSAHSYETAGPGSAALQGNPEAIAHSELSNGPETTPPQEALSQLRNRRSRRPGQGNLEPLLTQN